MRDTGKQILWIIVGVVIFMIVYILLTNPSTITNFFESTKGKLSNSSLGNNKVQVQVDPLVSNCTTSLNTCKDILNKKYGASFSIIEKEKFDDNDKAKEFYTTWKGILQVDLDTSLGLYTNFNTSIESNYPLVIFALKVRGQEGQTPLVAICDKSGEITKFTKQQLLCG